MEHIIKEIGDGGHLGMSGIIHKLFDRQYFIHSLVVLMIMNLFFFLTVGDISSSGKFLFVRKSIVCAIAIYAVQFVTGAPSSIENGY